MSRVSFGRSHTSSFRRGDSGNSTRREDAKSINCRGCWRFNECFLANHARTGNTRGVSTRLARRCVASELNVAEDSLAAVLKYTRKKKREGKIPCRPNSARMRRGMTSGDV